MRKSTKKQEKQDKESVCRFCLSADISNSFITPCKCIGTVQYVHKECLKQWIQITEIPEHKRLCQLCMTEYTYVRRYPYENLFQPHTSQTWFLLSRVYIFLILGNYAYFFFFSKLDNFYAHRTYMLCDYRISECSHYGIDNQQILSQRISLVVLTVITSMYGSFYFSLWRSLKNKYRYLTYIVRSDLNKNAIEPLSYFLILGSLFGISYMYFVPSAVIYIYVLSSYIPTHNAILEKLNEDGENSAFIIDNAGVL